MHTATHPHYLGVDPGKTGAAALLDSAGRLVALYDFPGDERALADLLSGLPVLSPRHHVTAAVEDVHAMPKQGVVSTFNFGRNLGLWLGTLAALRIPTVMVRPQAWQKGRFSKADGKHAALAVARRQWPDAELHLKKHHNRADALLIADWCRQTQTPQISPQEALRSDEEGFPVSRVISEPKTPENADLAFALEDW